MEGKMEIAPLFLAVWLEIDWNEGEKEPWGRKQIAAIAKWDYRMRTSLVLLLSFLLILFPSWTFVLNI